MAVPAGNLPETVVAPNPAPMSGVSQNAANLRIALFSGNYNYVLDGANQALNRLVGYALKQGAAVRVYSPVSTNPAFAPTGDLVGVPSVPMPGGRGEYKLARGLPRRICDDIDRFAPDCFHVSAPDILGHRAVSYARRRGIPVVASVHTLFETYPAYYGMGFLERPLVAMFRRFYNRCDALVAPNDDIVERLRGQGMVRPISIWSRGVDHARFNPQRRDQAWRATFGFDDNDLVIGFLGRVVLEKGLDVFAEVAAVLRQRGITHKVLIIGDGPARQFLEDHIPGARFTGFQSGDDLARAVASIDVLLNPSVTEAFGNVTLEAMAAGVPVVAADATGARTLVDDGVTGYLVGARDVGAYADILADYADNRQRLSDHGVAGHALALRYDWDAINQRVIDVYQNVIARRPT